MLKDFHRAALQGSIPFHGPREIHVNKARVKTSTSRPKVLVLAPRFPYPALSGGKVQLLQIAHAFSGCDITLLSLCASREEMEFEPTDGLFSQIHKVYLSKAQSVRNVLTALPTRTPLQIAYYRSDEFQRRVEDLLPQHDVVIAHLIRTGQYVQESTSEIPRILLMSDAISLAYQRMAEQPGAPWLWHHLYRVELQRLLSYEQNCPAYFDRTWLLSDVDRRFLRLSQDEVQVIPLGVDLKDFPFNPAPSGDVVAFIGNMSFPLNFDACNTFIREILPRLRSKGSIRFRVIGACTPAVKKKLEAHEGVEVTGTVRRIADAVEGVFCGACPIRGGSGMQNKVLNYMALGLPCVTTDVGLGGIRAMPGRDLFVYKQPQEAAGMILNLHTDAGLRGSVAKSGREFIEKEHDWEILHRTMRNEVARLIEAKSLRAKVS